MATKYTNMFHSKALLNMYTQIWIFRIKINHLATLVTNQSWAIRCPSIQNTFNKIVFLQFLQLYFYSMDTVERFDVGSQITECQTVDL
jgi:hypothetical protein